MHHFALPAGRISSGSSSHHPHPLSRKGSCMQRTSNRSQSDPSTTMPHGVHSTARARACGWLPVSPSATILETPAFPPPCARLLAHSSLIFRTFRGFGDTSSVLLLLPLRWWFFRLHLPRIVHPNEARIAALARENDNGASNPPAHSNNQLPSGASLTALSERDDRGRSGRR